jgi:hypothetical protein
MKEFLQKGSPKLQTLKIFLKMKGLCMGAWGFSDHSPRVKIKLYSRI